MPELDYAFLADYVRAEHGVAHVIAAGIDTVVAAEVPSGGNLGLLYRLEFTQNECGRPHRLEIIYQEADGGRLAHLTQVITPEWPEAGLPVGWRFGLMGGLNIGLPLPGYGEYALEILLNDTHKKTLHLRVIEPPADVERPGE